MIRFNYLPLLVSMLFLSGYSYSQVATVQFPELNTSHIVADTNHNGGHYIIHETIISGDFDNDGDRDVVYSGDNGGDYMGYSENLGGGNFATPIYTSGGNRHFKYGVALDINHDGNLDVIGGETNSFSYRYGNGDGTFGPFVDMPESSDAFSIDTADINNDGFADIVFGYDESSWATADQVQIMTTSPGGFVLYASIDVPNTTGAPTNTFENIYTSCFGDYNQDGFLDIGFVRSNSFMDANVHEYWLCLNDGLGGFDPPTSVTMPNNADNPTQLMIMDYDEDGTNEFVVLEDYGLHSEDGLIEYFAYANHVRVVDFDDDGKKDFMVLNLSKHHNAATQYSWYQKSVYWMRNHGAGYYTKHEVMRIWCNFRCGVDYFDVDEDGDIDILTNPNQYSNITGPMAVYWHEHQLTEKYVASGNVWYDENQDKDFDVGEIGFPNRPILNDGVMESISASSGYFSFWTDTLNHTITTITPPGWYVYTDSLSYLLDYNGGFVVADSLNFGLYYDSLFSYVDLHDYGGNTIRCDTNSNLYMLAESYGTELASAQVAYTLDTLLDLNSLGFTPDSIVGQTIYWTIDSIWVNNYYQGYWIKIDAPGAQYAGQFVSNSYTAILYDQGGIPYDTIQETMSQMVRCSYDPNDKQVEPIDITATGNGYIEYGQDLTYLIRFQNTGNDTAYTVNIMDDLSELLDHSTLQVVSASDPYTVSMSSSGTVSFLFENIDLPDSTTDYDGSQGYIEFVIQHVPILDSNDYNYYITNHANIYFDNNEAVVTNSTLTRIYNCDSVKFYTNPSNLTEIYPGETITAYSYEPLIDTYSWQMNGIEIGTDSLLVWPSWADSAGTYNLTLTVSNEICTKTDTKPINMFPIDVMSINTTICSVDSIYLEGDYRNIAGVYYDTLANSWGYDSILVTNLALSSPPTMNLNEVVCGSFISPSGQLITSTGIYSDTVDFGSLCDSIYTIDLTVHPISSTDVITSCGAFTWIDGNIYTSDNFTATHMVTASTGCDSTISLNLIVNPVQAGTHTISSCDSVSWMNGTTYYADNNTDTYILAGANGCDSTVTLDLSINSSSTGTDNISACNSYIWLDGNTYTASNSSAQYIISNSVGCDSTITLDLIIQNPTSSIDVVNSCSSYTWIDGNTYSSNNSIATHTVAGSNGCDSTITLNLTINQPSLTVDNINSCGAYTWIDGNTYSSNNNTVTHTLTDVNGCDSVVQLNLTVNSPTSFTDVITSCGPYTWIDGNTYNSSNSIATHTLLSSLGCDSMITLNLTVNTPQSSTHTISSCDAYTWIDGNTYTSSNSSATMNLVSANGCDSIIILDLTIPVIDSTVSSINDIALSSNQSGATYQWVDCMNNMAYLNGETNQQFTAPYNGSFATIVTLNGCTATSECQIIDQVDLSQLPDTENILIFPNPNIGVFTLEHSYSNELELRLIDATGKTVLNKSITESKTSIDASHLASGMYVVELVSDSNVMYERLIIQNQ